MAANSPAAVLGLRYRVIATAGNGVGSPVSLTSAATAATVAPVLTLDPPVIAFTSPITDNTPEATIDLIAAQVGDVITWQRANAGTGFATNLQTYTRTITLTDLGTLQISSFGFGSWADGTYDNRAKVSRTGVPDSAWSSTVTKTISVNADLVAPTLSSVTGTQNGATAATVGVTTNEANGTLYVFVSASPTPPTAAALKAGTGAVFASSQAITTTGAKTFNATPLSASTVYYAHFLHRDAAGNESTIVSSASFTTAAPSGPITWDSAAKSADLTLSNGSLTVTHTGSSNGNVRATVPYGGSGAKSYSVTFDQPSHCSIGFATAAQASNDWIGDQSSIGYLPNLGALYMGSDVGATGVSTAVAGDVIEMELSGASVRWRKNSGAWSSAVTITPIGAGPYYPAVAVESGATATANFSNWG